MRSLFSKMPKSFAFALKWLIRISLQVPTVVARHGRIKFSLILVFYHFHISMKSFLVPIADITQVWWKQSQDENVNNKKRKKKHLQWHSCAHSVIHFQHLIHKLLVILCSVIAMKILDVLQDSYGWDQTYFINAEMHHRACSVILVVQNLEYQLKKPKKKKPGCASRRFLDFE